VSAVALGYKRDAHDPNDYPAERLLGRPLGDSAIVPVSLLDWRVGVLRQRGASSCVAHAIARAIDVSLRYKARNLPLQPAPPRASRRFLYFNGRWAEYAGTALEATAHVEDSGCYPRNAMRAVKAVGVCAESFFPYTDRAQLAGETAEGTINEVPSPAAYHAAFDQMAFTYYRISSVGEARVNEVSRALALGHPVVFGMFVDSAFMAWDGATTIDQIDQLDPEGGGHMMCALETNDSEVVSDNWWDETWGRKGYAHLSYRLFGSSVVTDAYVIETAADFSGGAS
jgi:hypothetical protein